MSMLRTVPWCLALSLSACASRGEDVHGFGAAGAETGAIPKRRGSVIAEGCSLDAGQLDTLSASGTRAVVVDVVLVCLAARADGAIAPTSPADRAALALQLQAVRGMGYRAHLALTIGEQPVAITSPASSSVLLGDAAWRAKVVAELGAFGPMVDGFELAPWPVAASGRPSLVSFVGDVSAAVRAAQTLAIHVPPSVSVPSDLPDGDAFDVAALAPLVDRVRVMTLDLSSGGPPGPTTDSGWAVDAARVARSRAGGVPVDVSLPLYGWDFGPPGERSVSFASASSIAAGHGARVGRGPTGAATFSYAGEGGVHEVWFDDTASLGMALRAWDYATVPADVGVTFYGLGAEQPGFFSAVAEGAR